MTKFRPSLETLGDRITPDAADPVYWVVDAGDGTPGDVIVVAGDDDSPYANSDPQFVDAVTGNQVLRLNDFDPPGPVKVNPYTAGPANGYVIQIGVYAWAVLKWEHAIPGEE